ncbi:MAG: hypothetical protein ABIZ56_09675, partial [Chthoniobacteraceae bacterium]
MILPVQQRHPHRYLRKRLSRFQSPKASSDDHDPWQIALMDFHNSAATQSHPGAAVNLHAKLSALGSLNRQFFEQCAVQSDAGEEVFEREV